MMKETYEAWAVEEKQPDGSIRRRRWLFESLDVAKVYADDLGDARPVRVRVTVEAMEE